METYREIIILITEDDDGHAELIRGGLEDVGVSNKMIRFRNGEEIWQFFDLQRDEILAGDKAYLLLLDINMPKMNGLEVLLKMKSDELFKEVPVIMLTTTDDPREVEQCYKLGCNLYVTKPVDFMKFAEVLRRLGLLIQIVKI